MSASGTKENERKFLLSMKKLGIIFLLIISMLFSFFTLHPAGAYADEVEEDESLPEAEYIFGRVAESSYTNELYDKAVTLESDWFMSDASARASGSGKKLSDLLLEVDSGEHSVIALTAMDFGLMDAVSDQKILTVEILNGTAKHGGKVTIEDYLAEMKKGLPANIVAFQQEEYSFAGKDYYSLLYTFSDDAPIRYERVVFVSAEDYLAHFQMMASDRAKIEDVLQLFTPIERLQDQLNDSSPDMNSSASRQDEEAEPRALAHPYLSAYQPVIDGIPDLNIPRNLAYGIRYDLDFDGIEELIALYLSQNGNYRYGVYGISNNSAVLRFEGNNSDLSDQLIVGVASFNGQTVLLEYTWDMMENGFTGRFHLIDPGTGQVVEEVISNEYFDRVGAVTVPRTEFHVGGDAVSEEEYLKKIRSIEIIDSIGISQWLNPGFTNQQRLEDVLYDSTIENPEMAVANDMDDTELRENAQLEIVANRVSVMTGNDVTGNGDFSGFSIFDPAGLDSFINEYINSLLENSSDFSGFDFSSFFGEETAAWGIDPYSGNIYFQ